MDRHITGGNGLCSQGAPGENGCQNCLSKGTNIQMNLISILWLVSTDYSLLYQSLAVDIETESKDSHRLLGGLGDDLDGSRCFSFCDTNQLCFSGLMGGSLSRVTALLGSGRSNRQVLEQS